jgi:hypothetical protein
MAQHLADNNPNNLPLLHIHHPNLQKDDQIHEHISLLTHPDDAQH